MAGGKGDMRLVIGRLINIRLPAHTMSTNYAANGVFDQGKNAVEIDAGEVISSGITG